MGKSMENGQVRALVIASAAVLSVGIACAQEFPSKTVRIIRKLGLKVE